MHYARTFDTVELNASFYRLPTPESVARWAASVPRDFSFAWKASRFLTHMKKLKDPTPPIARMMDVARGFGPKLGVVLYQLPPRWVPDEERLETFLQALPVKLRSALELREETGYVPRMFSRLKSARVALVVHDMAGSVAPRVRTAPFVYVRLHGPDRYGGSYSKGSLASWAAWIAELSSEGADVFAYFNNDRDAHAPRDAVRLREAIARRS